MFRFNHGMIELNCEWPILIIPILILPSGEVRKTLEIEMIGTIDSTGFRLGERFGRNITVNQFDCFSSNSIRCLYVTPCTIIRNQELEILAYEIE
jgi:hypothetical protein